MLKNRFVILFGKFSLLKFSLILLCSLSYFTSIAQQTAHFQIDQLKNYTKRSDFQFSDSLDLKQKLTELQFNVYKEGYWTFSIDSIQRSDSSNVTVFGALGERFKKLSVTRTVETKQILRSIGMTSRTLENNKPNPNGIVNELQNVLSKLENAGYPFAQIRFQGLEVDGSELKTELQIILNQRVKWLKLEITGKNLKISPKFIANYLQITEGDWYSQDVVNLIPVRMKQLTYMKEYKPAELLFTPDGATLYLYIESKPVSLFNGTVGLQQNPITQTVQLTGDIRLKLQNVLKKGEYFDLNWRSISPGSPQLRIQISYPYLFNTPFGIDGQFQLYKRDSTFLELKSSIGVNYFLSKGNTLKAFYRNQQSSLLGASANSNSVLGNVKSNQYGLSVTHQTLDYLPNPRRGLLWFVEGSAGQRVLTKDSIRTSSLLFSTKLVAEYYLSLSKQIVLKTAINAETYTANTIQQNELLRFGGNLNQRGFLEDELLATTKATGTVELRFILDQNSFLFAFYDQTWYERNTSNYLKDTPRGFGVGLSFGTNLGIFSLSAALGKQLNNPVLFRDSKIHFGYIAYF